MKNDIFILELDKARELKLTNKATKKLEKMYNTPISNLTTKLNSFMTEDLEKIMHVLLSHEDENLKLQDVVTLLEEHDISSFEMLFKILEVFTNSMGTAEEIEKRVEKITGKKINPSPNE